ncbi:MRN complex-interacting protein isoform X2 [Apus apus]|uniref:MRN complex-interacting protein isoform X2 n=1 Tax=Apus apus TaxID=8895 RepID=UPI0021F8D151|nr:MRN complex-interacting protein isoform X2 [Apus apus]
MAAPCWALRCCSCRLFQAKRSRKWSCSVCGQRQAVQKVYGQGSGLECRHHVQKLNLLQGVAEEAIGWRSRCVEESINEIKNTTAQHEDSSVQQEGRPGVSRWSKYLDKDSEDQEDGEEKAGTERQQFCSQGKNTVEEQRKHQMFLSSDIQEHAEENQVFQLGYQAKKRRKCLVAATNQDGEGAVSADSVVPAACESVVPEENAQTPTTCTKPSKWEKFLASSDYSKNGARVISSPQEGSGRLGLHSTTAAGAGMARCSAQAGRTLPQGTGFEFKKCVASTEQPASKLPSSAEEVLCKDPQSQWVRARSGVCSDSMRRSSTLVISNTGPEPSSVSCEHLFCTGDEFDDDL